VIVERLQHYFSTYKLIEGEKKNIEMIGVYGPDKAKKIISAAIDDYNETFGQG